MADSTRDTGLDLDALSDTAWGRLYPGFDMIRELRALREQVATLIAAMRDHADCRVCASLLASRGERE